MTITLRPARERGHFDHGWLDTYHTFSFGEYRDPHHVGFRSLRVINEDRLLPGKGFPTHPHADMEIVTYIVSGALEHRDSMGNGSVIRRGDIQRMSAGTGVTHSEFNPSDVEPVHLLQIWIVPEHRGLRPSYEQKNFPDEQRRGQLRLVGSTDGREGSVRLNADVRIFSGLLEAGSSAALDLAPGRQAWVQVVDGRLELNGIELGHGDGASASDVPRLTGSAIGSTELLILDLG
ncbi:MAG: pirin family protein [Candidatus Krumholzibacteriia bacterium]